MCIRDRPKSAGTGFTVIFSGSRGTGPDDDDAEGSYAVLDVTSTGIKMRNQWGDTNQNYDHLFMAFAEQPVSNPYGGQSNAR